MRPLLILLLIYFLLRYFRPRQRAPDWLLRAYVLSAPVAPSRRLFQTYHTKSKIPKEVFENIRRYAPEYEHVVLDDAEIEAFLTEHFRPSVLRTFRDLRNGAHKADLARYALLYVHGGVYLDIKSELIGPLAEIMPDPATLYTVLSCNRHTIYQGIISSPPRNDLFLALIDYIVQTQNPWFYLAFTADFYRKVQRDVGSVRPGENHGSGRYYLFEERCSKSAAMCEDGLDRYGFCCYVWDGDKPVIKTRRASYPWK